MKLINTYLVLVALFLGLNISHAQFSGGCVGDVLLFYKGDNVVYNLSTFEVTNWIDNANNGHNLIQVNSSLRPAYLPNALNGNALLSFSGTDHLETAGPVSSSGVDPTGFDAFRSEDEGTVIFFGRRTAGQAIFTHGLGTGRLQFTASNAHINGTTHSYNATIGTGYEIWVVSKEYFSGWIEVITSYRNGIVDDVTSSATSENHITDYIRVGNWTGSTGFEGEMGEIIVGGYGFSPEIVNEYSTYLSIKYGVSLDQSVDAYTIPGIGTEIWDNSSTCGHGDYNYDITGIGRNDCTGLSHTKSVNVESSGLIQMALTDNGGSYGSPNAFNNDNEFLMWGHDNGTLASLNTLDVDGSTIQRRVERVWKIAEVDGLSSSNPVGNVSFEIDLSDVVTQSISAGQIYLLIDRDGDGFADNDITPVTADAWDQGTGIAQFNNVDFRNCDNFTIGFSVNPLPVELVRFDATYRAYSNVADIKWSTASELNNDYFQLEKSYDLKTWNTLTTVQGAGTSSIPQYYAFQDNNIDASTIYYRLKQVDFDGTFVYSNVIIIDIPDFKPFQLSLYPNPTSDLINIEIVNLSQDVTLNIYDQLGRVVHHQKINNFTTQLNTESFQNGVYIIQITDNGKTEIIRFTKK